MSDPVSPWPEARIARLATVGADGRPHVVPICFALEGSTLYTAVDEKPKRTRRLRRLANIRENPRVEVLIDHYEEDWARLWWLRLRGTARVADRDERALELLQAKYAQYRERPPGGPFIIVTVDERLEWSASPKPRGRSVMGAQENRAAVERARAAFNDPARREEYLELYSAEAAFHGFPPDVPPTFEGIKAFYGVLWGSFPDIVLEFDDVVAEGDRVAIRYHATGTHSGEFMGAAPSGNTVVFEGMTILRFDDEACCVERWQGLDAIRLMVQLGLMAPPS